MDIATNWTHIPINSSALVYFKNSY